MVLWEKNIANLGPSCEEKVLMLPVCFHCAGENFFVTVKYRILIKEQGKRAKRGGKKSLALLFKKFLISELCLQGFTFCQETNPLPFV